MKKTLILIVITFISTLSPEKVNAQWHYFNTTSGYIRLGPQTSTYGNIETDRAKFLFNKPLYVSGGVLSSYGLSNLSFQTNGSTKMTIKSSTGNVGIGVKNPSNKLHVAGDTRVGGALIVERLTASDPNPDWHYGLSVWVDRDYTKAFTVNTAGSPTSLFTVWGNGVVNAKKIYAEEIEVRVDAIGIYWPDYVFKPNYKLRPLYEVENYIGLNCHLPGVPSEKEVLEDGLNLGEMDAILLKKVEELTLYMIKQQKELDSLKKELKRVSQKSH